MLSLIALIFEKLRKLNDGPLIEISEKIVQVEKVPPNIFYNQFLSHA